MAEPDLRAVAFPTLDEAQLAALGRCAGATPQRFRDGQRLFQAGDRNFNFYVVKSGAVEVLDESGDTPKALTVHRPGAFTGDVSHLTGDPAVVSAVARGDTEVYAVSPDRLREVLNQCPDLSDLLMQAFIARRQLVRESGEFTGLRVLGSRYSQDTFCVRDFLARNRMLFTWLDLESDPQVDKLLKRFGLTEADTPVVAWAGKLLLRNPSNRELAEAIGTRRPLEQTVYEPTTAGCRPTAASGSRAAASTTPRPPLRRNCAAGRTWWSSAAATAPARLSST
ncbi:MAG TPA: cyclic nucleotide-binding domain-containing protein [Gemmataceae bacterium]|nr:cyclic nucleotide-binding domain-containing protein [Gemmataceae bacterium]